MPEPSSVSSQAQLDLLGTVAHDLKTPIAAVKSYADLIQQSGELNERQQHYLGRIHLALTNMTTLVNDLLDLVWLEGGMSLELVPCNLLDIVRVQMETLEGYAKAQGVTLHLEGGDDLALVLGDERRLGQVVSNLISNGIKYNRPGGNVWMQVERVEDSLQVTCRDDGPGIASEDLPHIFARFFRGQHRAQKTTEGSGLGLAIARAIVERHDGAISVGSVLGRGSTFRFTIPFASIT